MVISAVSIASGGFGNCADAIEPAARATASASAEPSEERTILKRLLRRDSGQMIDRLRREIAARAARQ